MSEHTPGPWHMETEPMNIWNKHGALIARANCPFDPDSAWEEGCANARLICAAPDLLQVAIGLHDLNRDNGPNLTGPVWRDLVAALAVKADVALAKVKGGAS